MAVAETLAVDPMDVAELNDVIDPDALDRLVRTDGPTGGSAVRISFTFAGCSVSIDGSGTIDVMPTGDTREEPSPAAVASTPAESTNSTD